MQERKSYNFLPKILYENRYCYQDDFSVLVCGGVIKRGIKVVTRRVVNSVYKLDCPKFKSEEYASMPNELEDCKTAVVNSDLFILGGFSKNHESNNSIRKFCSKTKTWSLKANLHLDHEQFCVCSFKKKYM